MQLKHYAFGLFYLNPNDFFMKKVCCFLIFITIGIIQPVRAGGRDSLRHYLSLETLGANGFYDMPEVQYYYKYKSSGLTYGFALRWNMGRGFYTGIGYMFSSSLFKADTTGIPVGALDGLEREIGYRDFLFLIGKDFKVIFDELTIGVYAGTLSGTMTKGKQYKEDVINYGPPPVVLYKEASYTYHPNARMLGLRISYRVSSRINLNLNGFKRWFDPIDYDTMDKYRGRMEQGAVYRKWYGGFGLQYQFFHKPWTDKRMKGFKQKVRNIF